MHHIDIGKDRPARLAVCTFALCTLIVCGLFSLKDALGNSELGERLVRSAFCTAETSDAELYEYRGIYAVITERQNQPRP